MSADTTQAQPEPAEPVAGEPTPEPTVADEATPEPGVAQPAEMFDPSAPILSSLLAERPEWTGHATERDVKEDLAVSYLDNEPSVRVQFGLLTAEIVSGYEADQHWLTTWDRNAWARVTDHITHQSAA
jgi:hypothetical protein